MTFTEIEKVAVAGIGVLMIDADGKIEDAEKRVAFPVWDRMGITENHIRAAANMEKIQMLREIYNMTAEKKRLVTALLGTILVIDRDYHEEELALLRMATKVCDLPPLSGEECLNIISAYME